MPAPATYSEDDLVAYMLTVLGDVGADLGISSAASATGDFGDLTEPLNDVLLDAGASDVTTITGEANITKLRALARVHAWRLARSWSAARYNMSHGTQRLDRGSVFKNIERLLAAAEADARALGATFTGARLVVKVGNARYTQDPYAPEADDRLQRLP